MESNRKVVLLVAEAVTLAHYGRIATLSRALPAAKYRVIVAADPRYRFLDDIPGVDFQPIWTIPSSQFAHALERGRPLYDERTLMRYVEADLGLMDAVKPDLVVGDFRLSLAVSAPLRKIPYVSVVNAYWSPYAHIKYPVPELPFTRITGLKIGQAIFDLVRRFAFSLHARPLNKVRRNHGLDSLGSNLGSTYTWADYTLYADIPELVATHRLPRNHRFIGPVLWSTQTALPEWWGDLPQDKPVVFVTLGSSGRADLLPLVLDVLSELPVSVIAATAGKSPPDGLRPNVFCADYLPMETGAARSAFVVCNGGSLTSYQALAAGVPVLGICSNMDQLLNMNGVQALGAGIALRAGMVGRSEVRAAASTLLGDPELLAAAGRVRRAVERCDSGQAFQAVVAEILHSPEQTGANSNGKSSGGKGE